MLEHMLEPLPGFIEVQTTLEELAATGAIIHPAPATRDTVRFLRTIGINPHDLLARHNRDVMRQIKGRGPEQDHHCSNRSVGPTLF